MTAADRIRREIIKRELTVTEAADLLEMSRPNFSNVLNGNMSLSVPLALKVEDKFGLTARELLIQQLDADIAQARKNAEEGNGGNDQRAKRTHRKATQRIALRSRARNAGARD